MRGLHTQEIIFNYYCIWFDSWDGLFPSFPSSISLTYELQMEFILDIYENLNHSTIAVWTLASYVIKRFLKAKASTLICVPQHYVLLLFWSHSVCILGLLSVFLYERQYQTGFKVVWLAYLAVMVMPKLLWFWSSIARDRQKAALHNELVCIHDTRSDCVRIMATCGDDISPSDAKKYVSVKPRFI